MKRFLLIPLVAILGCEGVGASYNILPTGTKVMIMALVAVAFFIVARNTLPGKTFLSQTE